MILKYKCICCGHKTLEHSESIYHEICPVCFWENDPIQNENPDYEGGANKISLNQAKKNFHNLGAVESRFTRYVKDPLDFKK